MSPSVVDLSASAIEMRREFDLSFSRPPAIQSAKRESFLATRFNDDAYAIRVSEIAGLHADCSIMSMPTAVPALLGIAGFRGMLAPVYDLANLLGYQNATAPRWLVLVRLAEPVALAFETFDSHFSADPGSIVKASQTDAATSSRTSPHHFEAIHTDDATRLIIHLPSLIQTIQRIGDMSIRQRSI